MSTIASTSPNNRYSLLRLSVIGGLITGALHLIIQVAIVFVLIAKTGTLMAAGQYIASGALGMAAFDGGIATALLGVFFHLIIAFVIAGVFILAADRIPLLRRNAIVGSLLYGFGVFVVMNFIVTPLSATPAVSAPPTWLVVELVLEHILLIGLPLGILLQRNTNIKK